MASKRESVTSSWVPKNGIACYSFSLRTTLIVRSAYNFLDYALRTIFVNYPSKSQKAFLEEWEPPIFASYPQCLNYISNVSSREAILL